GVIEAGETVGEMALLSGQPRVGTVRALRDSELVRLSREAFDRLAHHHPKATLHVARLAVQRLESAMHEPDGRTPRSIALIGLHPDLPLRRLADDLLHSLERFGPVRLIDQSQAAGLNAGELSALESDQRVALYLADYDDDANWRQRCLRQADRLLLLADAEYAPEQALAIPRRGRIQSRWLLLRHRGAIRPGAALAWSAACQTEHHHHWRQHEDLQRLARELVGQAAGIVLSGGGARGFAHIGVIRALREAGLQIDRVGGTSIGALMAAGVALEWSDEEQVERMRRAFVATNPVNDYTLPLIALVRGRKASRMIAHHYGQQLDIEDLPLPFYCVSSNLTSGQVMIHQQGRLWRALRASVAIPGLLPPVFEQGQVLVDGGVINNLPLDVMRQQMRGPVIGVDIAGEHAISAAVDETESPALPRLLRQHYLQRGRRPGIAAILLRAGMVNSAATAAANLAASDLVLRPPVNEIDLLDWRHFDRAIEIGYRYTQERLRALPAWHG
ncbi:MAG: patatin-like phospholipase family protein, partial [Xanthomonadales bacterium]|nr:patatin-like phospholipase family protein [Xanthomonadales bacterium]